MAIQGEPGAFVRWTSKCRFFLHISIERDSEESASIVNTMIYRSSSRRKDPGIEFALLSGRRDSATESGVPTGATGLDPGQGRDVVRALWVDTAVKMFSSGAKIALATGYAEN